MRPARGRPAAQFLVLAPLLLMIVFFAPRTGAMDGAGATTGVQAARSVETNTVSVLKTSGGALANASVPLTVFGRPATTDGTPESAAVGFREARAQAVIEERKRVAEESRVAETSREDLPIFYEHEVQSGDTVTSIAARYGISPDYIVWNNVDILDDADALAIGIVLQVPSVEGMIHSARVGDTVTGIAELYDADIGGIVDFEANGFNGNPDNLREGSLILVPGGRPQPPAPPEAEPTPEATPDVPAEPEEREPLLPTETETETEPEPEPAAEPDPEPAEETPVAPADPPGWLWPATGRITNFFGPRHPLGIDISMVVGTPLIASSAGQAVFVGGNPCCSYGSHVIIDHGNGYETLYAHLSQFAVSNGEWVEAGQVIGYSGSTGRSTGPHLHFEIRKHGVYSDPMLYLP